MSSSTADCNGTDAGEIMLFGVRVVVDSMRKSVSLNNLSQYEQPSHLLNRNDNCNKEEAAAVGGYASADNVVPISNGSRDRKRGVPWTEDEHRLFLLGLQKVGKGEWRGIAKNFVKTRTPTQVASHAQKYFLRRSNNNRRRRRSSLFDITTEMVSATPMEEEKNGSPLVNSSVSHPLPLPTPETSNITTFSMQPTPIQYPINNLMLGRCDKLVQPIPIVPVQETSTITDLNLSLGSMLDPSLRLSLPSEQRKSSSSSRYSAFQVFSSFSKGDKNIISVS